MLLVHAESSRVLDELIARHHTPELMKQYGARAARDHAPELHRGRGDPARGARGARSTGGQLYIVHMSTAEGADIVRAAQARGVPVLAETCVQYLVLDDSVFAREDGHLFACCPQLKKPADVRAAVGGTQARRGLRDLDRHVHLHARAEGDVGGRLDEDPDGDARVSRRCCRSRTRTACSEGGSRSRRCARSCRTNPAQHHGPRAAQGRDRRSAPTPTSRSSTRRARTPCGPREMETNADWSPFEGWELAGFARTTLSRGEVIVDDYKVVGPRDAGVAAAPTGGSRRAAAIPASAGAALR